MNYTYNFVVGYFRPKWSNIIFTQNI